MAVLTHRFVHSEDGCVRGGRLDRDAGGYHSPAHLLRSDTPPRAPTDVDTVTYATADLTETIKCSSSTESDS
jgi:hypothetical protein